MDYNKDFLGKLFAQRKVWMSDTQGAWHTVEVIEPSAVLNVEF